MSENGPINQWGHLSEKGEFPCIRMYSLTISSTLQHDAVGSAFSPATIAFNDHKQFYDLLLIILTFQTTTSGCLTRPDSPDIRFDPYRVHQASQFRGFNINIIRTPDL